MLRRLPVPDHPDLLVGTSTGDDAAVWRVDADRALIATVDFFTPVVDDARTWGAIAAANSASDVYAMGGRPLFALNVAGWPRAELSLDLLADVLEGAAEIAARGGWLTVGGHTIDAAEPMYGQSVLGEVHPDRIMTNDAARPGQTIVLTKPLGIGLLTTALKRSEAAAVAAGGALHELYTAAVASMTRLNDEAAASATSAGVRAATDVTGFGLLGHLHKLVASSGCAAVLDPAAVPMLPGAADLVAQGFVPGGTGRNLDFVREHLDVGPHDPARWSALLADPQTSGGLAMCVPSRTAADEIVGRLRSSGHDAAVIGETIAGPPGMISLR